MTEPTVQVPVSLIERAAYLLNKHHSGITSARLRALISQQTPTTEPEQTQCTAETHSWDHFRPEQVDSYWITCNALGPHDDHHDEHTGLTWRDPSTIRDVRGA